MSTVASLSVKLLGDTKDLEKSFGNSVKTATKWGAGLAAAAGVAGGAVLGVMKKYGNFADELLDLKAITGLSTDEQQKWNQVAIDAGVDSNLAANSLKTLNKQLERGNVLSPRLAKGFEDMGVSAEEFKKLDADEQMRKMVSTMMEMEDSDARAFANKMNIAEMLPMVAELKGSGEDLDEIMKNIPVAFDEDDLNKMNEFRQAWDNVKQKIFEVMGDALMPLFDWFSENMPLIEEITEKAFDIVGEAITAVSDFISDHAIPAYESFKDAIDFVKNSMNVLLPVVIGLTAAITAQAIIGSITNLMKIWRAATVSQTTVQWLLNAALNANPLGLVALAIGALIAIGVLLWKNWDTIKDKAIEIWSIVKEFFIGLWDDIKGMFLDAMEWIKQLFLDYHPVGLVIKHWETIKQFFKDLWDNVKDTFSRAVGWVTGKVDDLLTYFKGLPGKIKSRVSGMWDGIKESFKGVMNWIISKWNNLQLKIGGKEISLPFGQSFSIPSITLNTPNIPSLDVGTNMVKADGMAMLHRGEAVVPANVAGGGYNEKPQEVHVYLDGRELTNALGPMMVDKIRGKLGSVY